MRINSQPNKTLNINFAGKPLSKRFLDGMNKHAESIIKDKYLAARLVVLSGVAKDATAYAVRFTKSRNNQEIPEEKRGFVAALDLASGVITCLVQVAIGFTIASKGLQEGLCKKLFGHMSPKTFGLAQAGFIAGASLLGSTIIGERVIVPLIATPLASKIRDKYLTKEVQQVDESQKPSNKHTIQSNKHTIQHGVHVFNYDKELFSGFYHNG